MTMTLVETIIRNLQERKGFDAAFDIDDDVLAEIKQEMADAIDAHLTQPAQSVDAECLRELVTKWEARGAEERCYSGEYYSGRAQAYDACSEELADKLTAALQEKGNG